MTNEESNTFIIGKLQNFKRSYKYELSSPVLMMALDMSREAGREAGYIEGVKSTLAKFDEVFKANGIDFRLTT